MSASAASANSPPAQGGTKPDAAAQRIHNRNVFLDHCAPCTDFDPDTFVVAHRFDSVAAAALWTHIQQSSSIARHDSSRKLGWSWLVQKHDCQPLLSKDVRVFGYDDYNETQVCPTTVD